MRSATPSLRYWWCSAWLRRVPPSERQASAARVSQAGGGWSWMSMSAMLPSRGGGSGGPNGMNLNGVHAVWNMGCSGGGW